MSDDDVIYTAGEGNPFEADAADRDPIRRFRGRLTAPVTLWTAGDDDERVGLTVSSTLVVEGDPGVVVGVLNPLSDLYEMAVVAGRFTVQILRQDDRRIADEFAGRLAALDPFASAAWEQTRWGPRLSGDRSSVGCRYVDSDLIGAQVLVRAEIEDLRVGDDDDPLVFLRGRYRQLVPQRRAAL